MPKIIIGAAVADFPSSWRENTCGWHFRGGGSVIGYAGAVPEG
jgi:hypothetical protein